MKHINTIETGLSADPLMIRSISEMDNITIISNSETHSTNFHRLGREATILNINNLDYRNLIDSIKRDKIIKTYEFKPSAGKSITSLPSLLNFNLNLLEASTSNFSY